MRRCLKYAFVLAIFLTTFYSGFHFGKFSSQKEGPASNAEALSSINNHNLEQKVAELTLSNFLLNALINQPVQDSIQNFTNTSISAKTLVSQLSTSDIENYLKTTFGSTALSELTDTRVFSENILDLYYEDTFNTNTDTTFSHADIRISLSSEQSQENLTSIKQIGNATLFAHIEPYGSVGIGDQAYFIRWSHENSGEILLFDRKQINPESISNWVSYQPNSIWRTGTYRVSFFRFDDLLTPLGTTSFYISAE